MKLFKGFIKKIFCSHDYMPVPIARDEYFMCCPKCNKYRKLDALELYYVASGQEGKLHANTKARKV